MENEIKIARAAKLVGVRRADFQKLVKTGQLKAFEGKVLMSDLERLFPTLKISLNSYATEVNRLQKASYSNRTLNRLLPNTTDFESQLNKTRVQLLVEKQKAHLYETTLNELLLIMTRKRTSATAEEIALLDELAQWLVTALDTN